MKKKHGSVRAGPKKGLHGVLYAWWRTVQPAGLESQQHGASLSSRPWCFSIPRETVATQACLSRFRTHPSLCHAFATSLKFFIFFGLKGSSITGSENAGPRFHLRNAKAGLSRSGLCRELKPWPVRGQSKGFSYATISNPPAAGARR
jgi:hypothetical protein